ncbi:MAG: ATP-dependent Clp protease proteolytic subunit [Beijerinckiaceae bacterium]|nr:ATP-dependent Clp protease proteolytic subunit [Beijerinckiaceae bacterium]
MQRTSLLVDGQILLYGDVGDPFGWGDGFTPTDVIQALAEHGPGDVTVRINSGGGIAMDGMAIYSILKSHPGEVTVLIDGVAASAASLIAMGGARIQMRDGAVMMIHDAATITFGDAGRHEKNRDFLDKLSDNYAGVYAARSGLSREDARALMKAETWMTADEAIERGFASAKIDETALQSAAFDYRIYARAPKDFPVRTRDLANPAASAASSKGSDMKTETTAAAPAAPETVAPVAVAPTAAQIVAPTAAQTTPPPLAAPSPAPAATTPVVKPTEAILQACAAAHLSLVDSMAILNSSDTLEAAQAQVIARLAASDAGAVNTPGPQARVVADGRDRFKEGVTRSLLHKVGLEGGEVNEFTACNLQTLARDYVRMIDPKVYFADPMALAGAVLGMRGLSGGVMMSGNHSTSDFVEILANIANKSMLKGYMEAEETFHLWTAKGVLVDFKPQKRVDLNLFPALSEVPEGAEYKSGTIGDRGETIQLATYGKMFAITRQAIINDDMNAFSRVPMRMGRAAKRTVGNLAYAVLTANAAMADGVALFHADHGNLAGTAAAPSVDSLDAARSAMAKQKDPDAHATALNIRPKHFIVPVALEGKARVLMTAEKDPNASNANSAKPNHVNGLATVVSDARLDAASSTAWYLAADANMHDTIEVAYLNGNETPMIDQQDGWKVDGVEFKVRIDAGVKAIDFRGLYKNAGA